MHEIITNLHMHTRYSDGTGIHTDIAKAALQTEVDVVIVTDHNILVQGPEGYYKKGKNRVLMIIGEEIHHQARKPQKNHLLVFGANQELAHYADEPQKLINAVSNAGGLSFIAHPYDTAQPFLGETDITWENWEVQNFTGIEIWNGLSEFKARIPSYLHAVFYALFPHSIALSPEKKTLYKWDELMLTGKRIVGVGGSDAHAIHAGIGPIKRTLFPYKFHFKSINNHLLLPEPLSGDENKDRRLILDAFRAGHNFIGYDLPAPTKGFRFTAQGRQGSAIMGDEISAQGGVTLQVHLPSIADIQIIKDGEIIKTCKKQQVCTHITTDPGTYRVEAYRRYLGRKRGWIFSNPIYIR